MEDIATLWTFQESMDELKQKLHCMTYELEMTKKKASEEMKKNEEQIKKLLQLLQAAFKERDEAKAELNKLQQIITFNNNNNNNNIKQGSFDQLMAFSPDTPLFTNSGFTDSQSQSQSQSVSHVSSPVMDSLSYPPPAPAPAPAPASVCSDSTTQKMIQPQKHTDEGSLMIQKLAKGRPLPKKGRLLEAVLEAGPTLQTLMVAGSLPRWRNPPGVVPHHQIPPVDFKGGYSSLPHHNNINTPSMVIGFGNPSVNNCSNYAQNLQDFGSGSSSSGPCFMGGRLMPCSAVSFDYQTAKRHRIQ